MKQQFNITDIQITITNLASILKVHQRTLRIWDSEGILVPLRTEGSQRYYGTKEIKKAMLVLFLTRSIGMNLVGVKLVLRLLKDIKTKDAIDYLEKAVLDIGI